MADDKKAAERPRTLWFQAMDDDTRQEFMAWLSRERSVWQTQQTRPVLSREEIIDQLRSQFGQSNGTHTWVEFHGSAEDLADALLH